MQPLNPEPLIVGGQEPVEGVSVGKEALIIGGKKHNKTYKKKRHGNKSLTAWVKFVKKVAREEKLPCRDAMMRAKVRKDKGEKWMSGGNEPVANEPVVDGSVVDGSVVDGSKMESESVPASGTVSGTESKPTYTNAYGEMSDIDGGRRRRTRRGSKKRKGSKRRGSKRRR